MAELVRQKYINWDEESIIGCYEHEYTPYSSRSDLTIVAPSYPNSVYSIDKTADDKSLTRIFGHWSSESEKRNVQCNNAELPSKKGPRFYRLLRWTLLSTYRRIFCLVFLTNMSVLLSLVIHAARSRNLLFAISTSITATSLNMLLSILVRHEHVVNALFLVACSLPYSSPLILRRWMAKIYTYGGIHTSCGLAALVWYATYAVLLLASQLQRPIFSPAIPTITLTIFALLVCIATTAIPAVRGRLHNGFEMIHRFAGWTSVGLFWAQVILMTIELRARSQSTWTALSKSPSFWCLLLITILIIYPWTRLERKKVRAEYLSDHAMRLHFDHSRVSHCMAIRLSRNPLKENHAFAVIPKPNQERGFSVVVSNAGDWTSRLIQSPPERLWIRGGPMYGVLRVATLFNPVVIVATGSGIGPCLSLFNGAPNLNCRVLWSTPQPHQTYGHDIVHQVLRQDPKAVIVDTRRAGRPDLVALTHQLYKEARAEAVVIISNPKVTRKVVYGAETRGIPIYGPIFDS